MLLQINDGMSDTRNTILKQLYCRLKHELCLYAKRYCPHDAEDIVHQAFINCYERLEPGESEASQRSYLYNTVKNLCLNFLRNQKPIYTEVTTEAYTQMTMVDTHDYIYEYIDQLPLQERKILTLAIQGYSVEDISNELNMNLNTVKYYKKEAYAKIRSALNDDL